ncbi:hypothetical protein ACSHWO_35865 (plasmid) [Streptomyces sp. HUAS TT3]|uniref:hypothetical protein n=1 Tax=Streptomyces sp. HUAS TT3 TaxID=3447510 RepID=UPI003F656983
MPDPDRPGAHLDPAEAEPLLLAHPAVRCAGPGEPPTLPAHVTLHPGRAVTAAELHALLRRALPQCPAPATVHLAQCGTRTVPHAGADPVVFAAREALRAGFGGVTGAWAAPVHRDTRPPSCTHLQAVLQTGRRGSQHWPFSDGSPRRPGPGGETVRDCR